MRLVDDLFKNYSVKEDTLVPYGFHKEGDSYQYSQLIHNGEFELQVLIKNKILYARLIELEFNEEYTAIDRESITGFIAGLKEQCQTILVAIRAQCFQEEYFHFSQTKRIAALIKQKYGIEAERNTKGYGTNGIFRNPKTNKWVGLLMYNKKRNLVGDSEEKVEYLNLNFKQDAALYQREGIYHPYKNKNKHWIAVIMDDSLSDEEVMDLVAISYEKSN